MYNKTNPEWKRYLQLMIERPQLFIPNEDYKFITMDEDVRDYETKHHRTLGVLYESQEHLLVADLLSHHGTLTVQERLIPNTTAQHILIIPIINGDFVLLKKFHHATRSYIKCFPTTFVKSGYTPQQYSMQYLKELFGPFSATAFYLNDIEPNTQHYHLTTSVYAVKMERINFKKRKKITCDYFVMTAEEMEQYTLGDFSFPNRDSYTIAGYAMYMETKETFANIPFFMNEP